MKVHIKRYHSNQCCDNRDIAVSSQSSGIPPQSYKVSAQSNIVPLQFISGPKPSSVSTEIKKKRNFKEIYLVDDADLNKIDNHPTRNTNTNNVWIKTII